MIVMDASAAFLGLMGEHEARRLLAHEDVNVPHLADSELAQSLRRHVSVGILTEDAAVEAIDIWVGLEISRHAARGLLDRVWELRENVSAYDATYVALAEHLECPLVTADRRLVRAPGPACEMLVIGT